MRPTHVSRGADATSRWEVASRPIPAILRPHVVKLVGYVETSARALPRREFPGPRLPVIVEFGPPVSVIGQRDDGPRRYPGGFVAGLHDRHALVTHDGEQRGVQFDLTPGGAARLFGLPPGELSRAVVPLCDLVPWRDLPERLAECGDWAARLDLLEERLVARLADAEAPGWVEWATGRIEASGGGVSIGGLADELGYSARHVERVFGQAVGLSPKTYARVVRFGRLFEALRSGEATPWVELAAAHGYSDQAHLAREVRAMTGLTPTAARATLGAFVEADAEVAEMSDSYKTGAEGA